MAVLPPASCATPLFPDGDDGSEWDFQISGNWRQFTPAIFLADYRAAASTTESGDTTP